MPSYKDNNHSQKADSSIYSLGIEYPAYYDWHKDSLYGNIHCKIVLFANQERLIEVDAGPGCLARPYIDMNRIAEGNLYSDVSMNGQTIFSMNGCEIFRYDEEEMVLGFLIQDGDIYTLGQSRKGTGFSFRKNGELIHSEPQGQILGNMNKIHGRSGAIRTEGESFYYFYSIKNETGQQWYMAKDRQIEELNIPSDIVRIHDMAYMNGELHIVANTSSNRNRAIYINGDKRYNLGKDVAGELVKTILNCELFWYNNSFYILEEHLLMPGNRRETCLWLDNGTLADSDFNISGYWMDEMTKCHIAMNSDGSIDYIQSNADRYDLGDNCRIYGLQSVNLINGELFIVANPSRRELSPFLWKNGKRIALPINGFLFYVSPGYSLYAT